MQSLPTDVDLQDAAIRRILSHLDLFSERHVYMKQSP